MKYGELHRQVSLALLQSVSPTEAFESAAVQLMAREYGRRSAVYRDHPAKLVTTIGGRVTSMGDTTTAVVAVGFVFALVDIVLRHLIDRVRNSNGSKRLGWQRRRSQKSWDSQATLPKIDEDARQEIMSVAQGACLQWDLSFMPSAVRDDLPRRVVNLLVRVSVAGAEVPTSATSVAPRPVVSAKPGQYQADIGVLTVLSEETRAAVEILARGMDYRTHMATNGAIFHSASIVVGDSQVRLVSTQSLDTGQRSATVAYGNLRRFCAPPIVVLMGIAGGIHAAIELDDVVVADEVIYYESRRETPSAPLRRGQTLPVPAAIQHAINAFFSQFGEPAYLSTPHRNAFKVVRGPIGSGEAVVADRNSNIRTYLIHAHERTLAVEMEAGGVAQAYYEETATDGGLRGWLSIRGISDHADASKDDGHHASSSRNAAAVLEQMLPFLYAVIHTN